MASDASRYRLTCITGSDTFLTCVSISIVKEWALFYALRIKFIVSAGGNACYASRRRGAGFAGTHTADTSPLIRVEICWAQTQTFIIEKQ